LDHPETVEEALTLIVRGAKVTHESGNHDDHINAVALACNIVLKSQEVSPVYAVAAPSLGWSGHEPRPFSDYVKIVEERMREEEGMTPEEIEIHREREAVLGKGYRERGLLR
jgi:hypothetical protein